MIAKQRIAQADRTEIPHDGVVLVDAGTTTALLAELLPTDRELTVVTNSIEIAASLTSRRNLTMMLVGGRLDRRSRTTVDNWSLRVLLDIVVDIAFMGTEGLSTARGLTTSDENLASVKRAMIACSRRTILLADHTKIGADRAAVFGVLADIDTVITDTDVDPVLAEQIATAGPRLVLA